MIRRKIISKTYFIKNKDKEETSKSKEYDTSELYSLKNEQNYCLESEYDTELESLLQENTSASISIGKQRLTG